MPAAFFSYSELAVAVAVLGLLSLVSLVGENGRAGLWMEGLIVVGGVVLVLACVHQFCPC